MYALVTWDCGAEDPATIAAALGKIIPESERGPELKTCITAPCSDDDYKAYLAALDGLSAMFPSFSYFAFLIGTDTPKHLHQSGRS